MRAEGVRSVLSVKVACLWFAYTKTEQEIQRFASFCMSYIAQTSHIFCFACALNNVQSSIAFHCIPARTDRMQVT